MERIQEQIVVTISQESVQQRTDEQIVAVRVPTVQEQGFVPEIPRAQVVTRIREKRAQQRTVEQNVRAPVPTVQKQVIRTGNSKSSGCHANPGEACSAAHRRTNCARASPYCTKANVCASKIRGPSYGTDPGTHCGVF